MIGLLDLEPFIYRAAWAAQKTIHLIKDIDDGAVIASFTNASTKKKWIKEVGLQEGEYYADTAYETEEARVAYYYADTIIKNLSEDIQVNNMEVYLPDKEHKEQNFREELFPDYKANRRKLDKPVHFQAVIDYYANLFDITKIAGFEVDDAISIRANQLGLCDYTIITIDKDLDTVPGWHYNPVKRDRYFVDELSADHFFFQQVLTGDPSDNITGLYKVGPVKANRMLAGCITAKDMWEVVLEEYKRQNRTEENAILNARLLHLLTKEDELWQPPV